MEALEIKRAKIIHFRFLVRTYHHLLPDQLLKLQYYKHLDIQIFVHRLNLIVSLKILNMPSSHSILISASLIHLSPAEKKQAIQSLLLLGLSRYANNSGGSTSIEPAKLQKLHGKIILS